MTLMLVEQLPFISEWVKVKCALHVIQFRVYMIAMFAMQRNEFKVTSV